MRKIFIVEDDATIASLLSEFLTKAGFQTEVCQNFTAVLDEFNKIQPDMVLLDINLPAYDGFFWCGKIRAVSICPIIYLSSRVSDSDQVFAMMKGGDDYVTKPFSYDVLVAKINAQMRRTYGEYTQMEVDELSCGDCVFSVKRMVLTCENERVELTKTEAGIVRALFSTYPGIVERVTLIEEIWDDETFVEENTLNVTISRIRKKLESIGSNMMIKPVRGVGYRIGGMHDQ